MNLPTEIVVNGIDYKYNKGLRSYIPTSVEKNSILTVETFLDNLEEYNVTATPVFSYGFLSGDLYRRFPKEINGIPVIAYVNKDKFFFHGKTFETSLTKEKEFMEKECCVVKEVSTSSSEKEYSYESLIKFLANNNGYDRTISSRQIKIINKIHKYLKKNGYSNLENTEEILSIDNASVKDFLREFSKYNILIYSEDVFQRWVNGELRSEYTFNGETTKGQILELEATLKNGFEDKRILSCKVSNGISLDKENILNLYKMRSSDISLWPKKEILANLFENIDYKLEVDAKEFNSLRPSKVLLP